MSTLPFIPESAPFTPEQRAWLNGFLNGMFSRLPAASPTTNPAPAARQLAPLTILFGSQTGTAEALAKRAAKEAGKRGFAPTVLDMAQTNATKLAAEKNILLITSTYGEGEPPDNAKALHAALKANGVPPLSNIYFSVCALGDRNYNQFCRCGQDFDGFLEKLGAKRAAPRVDCDVEYEEPFNQWLDGVLKALGSEAPVTVSPEAPASKIEIPATKSKSGKGFSKQNPFPAPVLTVRRLSSADSQKDVNHVEFSLEGSNLEYEPGDVLGVWPQNCPELVSAVLAALHCDGEEAVATPAGELPLRAALHKHYDLGKPSPDLVATFATAGVLANGSSETPVSDEKWLDVLDVLQAHPNRALPPNEFVRLLRNLQPRLYSIASSPIVHPDQVHLTVGAVRYEAQERRRKGVCSTFLAERALAAGQVGVYLCHNRVFKLPADGARPIIMVGPGAGIAPFRAFLHERRAAGAIGRNWLFFGDQRAAHDFLYRDELEPMLSDGFLHRLDTAFSRDQTNKIYVQDRMRENSRQLFRWLEQGAYFYVCGDASRMAKDVNTTLLEIIQKEGGFDLEASYAYLEQLKMEKRYARDVY